MKWKFKYLIFVTFGTVTTEIMPHERIFKWNNKKKLKV